jgi:transcriptional regulator with XRE-family HTH domain
MRPGSHRVPIAPGSESDYRDEMDPKLAAAIAKNVRRLRKAAKFSQTDLARRAGVTLNTIHLIEKQKNKGIQTETLWLIANALGVRMDELAQEETEDRTYVDAFLDSKFAVILQPTPAEIAWLREGPRIKFVEPHPEVVFHVLLARRVKPNSK